MKTLLYLAVFLFAIVPGWAGAQSSPAVGFFLEVEGIQGEATAPQHERQIELVTLMSAVKQRGLNLPGLGAPSGRPAFQPLRVVKFVDLASPALFVSCATGKVFQQVAIHGVYLSGLEDQPSAEFYTITLKDVSITCVNTEGAEQDGENKLLETVTLSFGEIFWSYRPLLPTGQLGAPVAGGYNLKTQTKL